MYLSSLMGWAIHGELFSQYVPSAHWVMCGTPLLMVARPTTLTPPLELEPLSCSSSFDDDIDDNWCLGA
jgi:hypothetical protein